MGKSFEEWKIGDPMINDYHIFAIELCTPEELEVIKDYALRINDILREYFKSLNIDLIDFKLEFGKTADRACGRDFPRHLPLLGQHHPRKAGQGSLPPRYGQR